MATTTTPTHTFALEIKASIWDNHVRKLENAEFEKQLVEVEGHFTDVWDD